MSLATVVRKALVRACKESACVRLTIKAWPAYLLFGCWSGCNSDAPDVGKESRAVKHVKVSAFAEITELFKRMKGLSCLSLGRETAKPMGWEFGKGDGDELLLFFGIVFRGPFRVS